MLTMSEIEILLNKLKHEYKRYDAIQDSYGNIYLTVTLNNGDVVEMSNPEVEHLLNTLSMARYL